MSEYYGGKRFVQYGDKVVEVADSPPIRQLIYSTGIKPAESKFHEYLRRLLCAIILLIIIWEIATEKPEIICIEDLEPAIKKDSLMYKCISEIDGEAQQKYLRSLKHTLNKSEPGILKRYSKSIKITLAAGVCSEYIINGNMAKPMGIIAKTIVYSAIAATISK